MSEFRRWLAGWLSWAADRLYPHYSERMRRGLAEQQEALRFRNAAVKTVRDGFRTDCAIYTSGPVGDAMTALERMESRGWNN